MLSFRAGLFRIMDSSNSQKGAVSYLVGTARFAVHFCMVLSMLRSIALNPNRVRVASHVSWLSLEHICRPSEGNYRPNDFATWSYRSIGMHVSTGENLWELNCCCGWSIERGNILTVAVAVPVPTTFCVWSMRAHLPKTSMVLLLRSDSFPRAGNFL